MIARLGNILFAKQRLDKFKKLSNLTFFIGLILLILYPFLSDNIFIVEKQLKYSESFTVFQKKEDFFSNVRKFLKFSEDFFHKKFGGAEGSSLKQASALVARYTQLSYTEKKAFFNSYFQSVYLNYFSNKNFNFLQSEITLKNNENNIAREDNIFTLKLSSQRGDYSKFIIFNIIYDQDKSLFENQMHFIFAYLKNFDSKVYYNYLAKDILFNFIPKDLFYNNPHELYEKFITDSNFNSMYPEYFINLDLTNLGDFAGDSLNNSKKHDNRNKYFMVLKINGMHSENLDMDYYKIFFDNFLKVIKENVYNSEFFIKTYENEFAETTKRYITKTVNYLKSQVLGFLNNFFDTVAISRSQIYRQLADYYIYLSQNISENYFFFNKNFDLNDLLISQGRLAILIKPIPEANSNIYSINIPNSGVNNTNENAKRNYFYPSKGLQINFDYLNFGFNLFSAFERGVKVLNKCEIDIFRGDHNYILAYNNKFQGTGLFILIPVLCVLRIFYEILEKIYYIRGEEKNLFEKKLTYENYLNHVGKNDKEILDFEQYYGQTSLLRKFIFTQKLEIYAFFQAFVMSFIALFFCFDRIINFNFDFYSIINNFYAFGIDNGLDIIKNSNKSSYNIFNFASQLVAKGLKSQGGYNNSNNTDSLGVITINGLFLLLFLIFNFAYFALYKIYNKNSLNVLRVKINTNIQMIDNKPQKTYCAGTNNTIYNDKQIYNTNTNSHIETSMLCSNEFLHSTKAINQSFFDIIMLFYIGLNLFLLFFLNYAIGLLYAFFILFPEFLLINLKKIISPLKATISNKTSRNSINSNIGYSKAFLLMKICEIAFTFIFIFAFYMLYFVEDKETKFSLLKYFNDILLNNRGNYNVIKFIYLDILFFYCLKIQKVFLY